MIWMRLYSCSFPKSNQLSKTPPSSNRPYRRLQTRWHRSCDHILKTELNYLQRSIKFAEAHPKNTPTPKKWRFSPTSFGHNFHHRISENVAFTEHYTSNFTSATPDDVSGITGSLKSVQSRSG